MVWRIDSPQGNEAAKCKFDIVQYTRGVVLDLGAGPVRTFGHWLTVDNKADTALFGIDIKPDVVVDDCTNLDDAINDASVDSVFSSHLLEHLADPVAALTNWWAKLKPSGYLVLYLPHARLYPCRGKPGANPDHKHDFMPEDIYRTMLDVAAGGFDLLVNEVRDQDAEYSFLQVFQKRDDGQFIMSFDEPKPEKTVCIFRAGGFGDMIQAANLFPAFKRDGYSVTVCTTPQGKSVIELDPHVDDWLIVDPDQVKNSDLPLFWSAVSKRYTKFVQLSESIEGTLLAMPGRANHMWPAQVRRMELNRNYLEWTSQLAEVPYRSEARFYPSVAETGKASRYLADISSARNPGLMIGEAGKPTFYIMWALAGSSMHKFTPHMDAIIARVLLEIPEAVVILTGDEACQILECGWELEPRVYRESGKQAIRETLTLAKIVDCVVGPETGVLNAVAFEPNAKVVMLSHSTRENLTKHWTNTASLVAPYDPDNRVCGNLACHRLHYGATFCAEDEATGAAKCQVAITPAIVFDAIHAAYLNWKKLCNCST